MGAKDITGNSFKETGFFHVKHGAPKGGLATVRFEGHLLGFRINLSIVGPETEKLQHNRALTRRQAEDILKAISNLVEALVKEAFGQDSVR